jgi:hypothetical protein
MRYLLLLLLLAGCKQPEYRDYLIKVVKPDGEVYKVFKTRQSFKPIIYTDRSGCLYTYKGREGFNNMYAAPVGWMLEVE